MNLWNRDIVLAAVCAFALAILATGCGPSIQEANEAAREFCAGHGGVAEIEYFDEDWPSSSSFDVYCRDGSEIE